MLRRECDSRQDSRCASALGNPPRKASPLLEGNPTLLSLECDNGSSHYFCLEHVEELLEDLMALSRMATTDEPSALPPTPPSSVRLASLDELAVDPAAAGRVTPERVESRGFQLNLGQSIGVPSLCSVVMKRIAHLFREMRLLT